MKQILSKGKCVLIRLLELGFESTTNSELRLAQNQVLLKWFLLDIAQATIDDADIYELWDLLDLRSLSCSSNGEAVLYLSSPGLS